MNNLQTVINNLNKSLEGLKFSDPVTHVYNPLDYAAETVFQYLEKYGRGTKKVLFLGMNPGPFGMAQTGVPFGEITAVRDWLNISGSVGKPDNEHPDRPIQGFACTRSEVSGFRLWNLFKDRFGEPQKFFTDHFIWNYCPLLFSEIHRKTGRKVARNLTPDKIKSSETKKMYKACDQALKDIVKIMEPEFLVGVGAFAESCFKRIFPDRKVHRILHPSPASPIANKNFAGKAVEQLEEAGIW